MNRDLLGIVGFIGYFIEDNSCFFMIVKFLCLMLVISGNFENGGEDVFLLLGFW